MKRLTSMMVLAVLCAAPAFAAAASFENVPVIDVSCSKRAAADPDAHTRDCALKCAGSGFGIVTQDQKFLKFDAAGNAKITEALKASDKKDHLRVNVDGDVQGDTLKVKSVTLL
jgi:opacity protein-like surface antigen